MSEKKKKKKKKKKEEEDDCIEYYDFVYRLDISWKNTNHLIK